MDANDGITCELDDYDALKNDVSRAELLAVAWQFTFSF